MAIEQYRKSLHLRAARPQDLRFDAWLDFLAVAAERAPQVWRDLYTSLAVLAEAAGNCPDHLRAAAARMGDALVAGDSIGRAAPGGAGVRA
jgi:hypothetical protein